MATPTITIGTPSATKISAISGHDRATVTFQSDMALQSWEARATTAGQTIGHGSGLLVESGGNLAANTNATVNVDDEELTNGDNEYTISVFGHGSNGYWSDGTYEGINLFDISRDIIYTYNVLIVDKTISFDTEGYNLQSSGLAIDLYLNNEYQRNAFQTELAGNYSFILQKDSSFDLFNIVFSGDGQYAVVDVNPSMMENGSSYQISFSIDSLLLNSAVVSNISIVKVVD